jgi:hypothetical protein
MVAYTDNSVSIDEYLRISYETEQQQRNLLATFSLAAKRFPQSMQDSIDDLEENYRNRANAFHDLIAAEAARTDNVAWQAAFDEYGSHSFEEANLAIIEGLLATPEIAAAFAEGVEYDDFVEALRLAFGNGQPIWAVYVRFLIRPYVPIWAGGWCSRDERSSRARRVVW